MKNKFARSMFGANRVGRPARRNGRRLQFESLELRQLLAVVYRIDTGGAEQPGTPVWAADTAANPSTFSNFDEGGNSSVGSTAATIDMTHASIPAGTPMAMFQTERFDLPAGANMLWDFPVEAGAYEVRLYFAETFSGAFSNGVRVVDVVIEGTTVLDNYDIFADVGAGNKGVMKSFIINSDSNIDIDFMRVLQNPSIKGIEILTIETNTLYPSAESWDFGNVLLNQTSTWPLTLTNDNGVGGPNITINPASASLSPVGSKFSFNFSQSTPITLTPGQTTTMMISYTPTAAGANSATLTIPHNGAGSPLTIDLTGSGVAQIPISFTKSLLENANELERPTSMQFGPDGRLYISQQNGLIRVYTVVKNGSNDYDVTAVETISSIQQIANHNDDGVLNSSVTERLVTGLLVTGTAANPVIYVGSSDPRIGGGNSGNDTNLDTNSSILSRLTWNGSAWVKLDLVRGLPRSDEQHALNGMQLDTATNTLYLTVGGNTNMGAPSNNFAFLPEYAYSAAILSIDLDAIGNTTYNIPTLDDENRPGVNDSNDPFGGNNGKNQARIVPGGPVQIFAPGFRNPYDLVITTEGRFYTVDNGPNAGWGNVPVNEGPAGNATNAINEPGVTYGDGLHFITGPGYYGGHPNPTRSNPSNTFNTTNPQSPVTTANPIESDYQIPGVENGALEVYAESTNGMTEYTATNFGGAMQGDLLIASFDNTIKRVKLSADGSQIVLSENLFTNVGFRPLDVVSPATGPFAGSIWVVDVALGTVTIFEPSDGGGGTENDLDGDGYTNDDEIANGTNPNSPADVPPDYDLDFTSNLLDPDDDNDTLNDQTDLFAVDGDNGSTTPVGTFYTWENEGENLGGILGMGFTGMMSNGAANYESLFDPEGVTAGGAAGVFTIDTATTGTARGATNSQQQAFQFGVDVGDETTPFIVQTRVLGAFNGLTPQAGQEMGLYIGTGDQDNYIQLVLAGNGGGAVQTLSEINGVVTPLASQSLALPGPGAVDLWLYIDPVANTLQAKYSTDGTNFINVGGVVAVPAAWLAGTLAVGLISTNPAGSAMPVTWDHLGVVTDLTAGEAAAKVELFPGGSITNSSTARVDSFRIHNNSTAGKQIQSVTFNLSTTVMPDMVFDPNGTAGDLAGVMFIPNTGAAVTGQSTHAFLTPRDGGFDALQVNFTDFDPGETFTFRTDVDPTSVKGSTQPGPSNAADISGLELSGATITITFDDGTNLTGQLFALDEGVGFYQVHSEITLTEDSVSAAPLLSMLGVTTPAIVASASQTIRVTGPVGATVRMLQTEVALHLANVPNGGFDIDPYEANKVVFARDDVAMIGASGFVDIPVTLRDSLTEGGINYFSAVIEEADGRTSTVSNVIKVALNNLPPGSNLGASLSIAATSASNNEGNSATTPFTFTVTRSGDTSGTTTVNYAVTGSGTNQANAADFGGTLPSGAITFTNGQTSQVVTINVMGDTTVEPDETFTVTLSGATGGASIATATAIGTIINDDAIPASLAIAATSASNNEGNSATTPFTFTVTRSGNTGGTTTVNYAVTGSGTNQANAADFGGTLPSGVVTFTNGQTSQIITINVAGDTAIETNETFTVTLSGASGGATIATATAIGTILNDDSQPVVNGLIGEYFNGTNFTGLATTRTDATVNFPSDWGAAPAGTAVTADDNYSVRWTGFVETSTAGNWTFFTTSNDGVRLFIDDVQVINNFTTHPITENSGTISLTAGWHSVRLEYFQQGGVAEITLSYQGPGQAKTIIPTNKLRTTDPNAAATTLAIAATSASNNEGNSATTPFTFTVTRSGDTSGTTTVNYAVTGSGTNPANAADFGGTLPSGVVTFTSGQTSQLITINVSGDVTSEPNEGFTVTLSNPSAGAAVTTATALGSIMNDDIPGNTNGLLGEYFNSTNLTGTAVTTRVDGSVNFLSDWGAAPAGTAVTADDNYSVRWTGFVETSTAGNWTFFTTSNDGVRLFIDDVQVINNFTTHPITENSGTISLTAGWHSVRLEYFQQGGVAEITLSYQGPGQAKTIIPNNKLRTNSAGGGQFASLVPLAGDYDGNNTVDDGDYAVWRQQYGATGDGIAADGNADGVVDSADYSLWRNNFGASQLDLTIQSNLSIEPSASTTFVSETTEAFMVSLPDNHSSSFGAIGSIATFSTIENSSGQSTSRGEPLVARASSEFSGTVAATRREALDLLLTEMDGVGRRSTSSDSTDFSVFDRDAMDESDGVDTALESAFATYDELVLDSSVF